MSRSATVVRGAQAGVISVIGLPRTSISVTFCRLNVS
jgi:hypothetical protein